MGIDASMFVRTKQPIDLTTLQILRWKIGDAFGSDKFLIFDDPLQIMEYEKKDLERKATKNDDDDDEEDDYHYTYERHSLEIVDKIYQDGPILLPEEGEQFIQVNVWTRYYGKGYERGNITFLYFLARWLEKNIPGGEVWYGGDSSGILHRPFGEKEREELINHFLSKGHEPYQSSFQDNLGGGLSIPRCPNRGCIGKTIEYGWGPDYRASNCHSCGRNIWTNDGGKTWKSGRSNRISQKDDVFDYIMKDGKKWEIVSQQERKEQEKH